MLSVELSDGINSWSCRGKLFLKTLNSSEAKLPLSLALVLSFSLPQSPRIFMPVLDCLGFCFVFSSFSEKGWQHKYLLCVWYNEAQECVIILQHSQRDLPWMFFFCLFREPRSCCGFQKNFCFQHNSLRGQLTWKNVHEFLIILNINKDF